MTIYQSKPKQSRREREKLQRTNEIIDAAEKRFFERGFDGVSMDNIAKDLELSKPALYRYFSNKESLYIAVVLRGMTILNQTFKETLAKEQTGLGKVSGFLRALCFDYVNNHADYYRLLTVAREQRFMDLFNQGKVDGAKHFGNMALESINLLIEALILGIQDGTVRDDLEPVQTAIFLAAAAEAALDMTPDYQVLFIQRKIRKETYLQHSIDLMLHGIASKKLFDK